MKNLNENRREKIVARKSSGPVRRRVKGSDVIRAIESWVDEGPEYDEEAQSILDEFKCRLAGGW